MPAKLTIADMHALAARKGGHCLSSEYVNDRTKLRWRCAEGHEWETKPNHIQQGSWCPDCGGVRRRTIEEMRALAAERGGRCLATKYVNDPTNLRWRCAEGHEWDASPSNVKKGTWCPECAGSRGERLTRTVLARMFDASFPKVRPAWLRTGKRSGLELDGYAEGLGIAFEYHGAQHYDQTKRFGVDALRATQQRDARKLRLCHEHGVRLVVVPEFRKLRDISGCLDQIEAAVLFAGLKIPRRWKRPANLADLLADKPPKSRARGKGQSEAMAA